MMASDLGYCSLLGMPFVMRLDEGRPLFQLNIYASGHRFRFAQRSPGATEFPQLYPTSHTSYT